MIVLRCFHEPQILSYEQHQHQRQNKGKGDDEEEGIHAPCLRHDLFANHGFSLSLSRSLCCCRLVLFVKLFDWSSRSLSHQSEQRDEKGKEWELVEGLFREECYRKLDHSDTTDVLLLYIFLGVGSRKKKKVRDHHQWKRNRGESGVACSCYHLFIFALYCSGYYVWSFALFRRREEFWSSQTVQLISTGHAILISA